MFPIGVRHNLLLQTLLNMTRKYPPQPRKWLSAEELMAMRLQRQAEAERALREHAADQEAFHKNRERLKAERLAREARSDQQVGPPSKAPQVNEA
jgi:hypothetical protein